MKKKELVKLLKEIEERHKGDEEAIHDLMDEALLKYINDPKVTEVFKESPKWCA